MAMAKDEAQLPRRRGDGDGSIYAVSRQYKLKDGSVREKQYWVAEVTWTDPDGTARRLTAQRTTKSQAREELNQLRVKLATDGTVPKAKDRAITVGDALDAWLADKAASVKPSTLEVYSLAKRYLRPLASYRVGNLTRATVRPCLDDPKLSARMRVILRTVLRASLRPHAKIIREDLFPPRTFPRIERRSLTVWTPDQAAAFLEHTKATRWGLLWRLALFTGMRRGEMLALRWRNIHDGWIEVDGSLDVKTRTVMSTKTGGSRRRINIESSLQSEFEAVRGKPDEFVFATYSGRPLGPRYVHRCFRAAVRLAQRADASNGNPVTLPAIRMHDLRHTHATALLRANIHPKIVSERLGHASVMMTIDVYSHAIPSMQTEAASTVARLFGALLSERDSQVSTESREAT